MMDASVNVFIIHNLSQVHAYIISHLKKEMPSMFGKDSKKKELINNLGTIFEQIQREHQISPGDFPNLQRTCHKNTNLLNADLYFRVLI